MKKRREGGTPVSTVNLYENPELAAVCEDVAYLLLGIVELGGEQRVEQVYFSISGRLHDLFLRNDIDEDIHNVFSFAVGAAQQISPAMQARSLKWGRHWDSRPLTSRGEGPLGFSDVRSHEKQRAALMETLLWHLKTDPLLKSGAEMLLGFHDAGGFWTKNDDPQIEY